MSTPADGVIKFNYKCDNKDYVIPHAAFAVINPVRKILHNKGFIGVYSDGISYGNLSIRSGSSDAFFISGSNTGFLKTTHKRHYVKVTQCTPEENLLVYEGMGLPSSESLSHYIIYKHCSDAKAVIHIHNRALWVQLKDKVVTSSPLVTYGSIEMCKELTSLFKNTPLAKEKILVMGGHEDGIIVFGEHLRGCLGKILSM